MIISLQPPILLYYEQVMHQTQTRTRHRVVFNSSWELKKNLIYSTLL